MAYRDVLQIASEWAAILTLILAAWAYGWYVIERCQKRLSLERYLRSEKEGARDNGQRTILHLVAQLAMTEADVMDAAFRSKRVRRVVSKDSKGRAELLLLEYIPLGS